MAQHRRNPLAHLATTGTAGQLLQILGEGRSPGCSLTGWVSVQIGVLFLPTSALVAGLALLFAITVAQPTGTPRPLDRPLARALLLLSALMLLALITARNLGLAVIGVFNWIPFFWFFLAVEPYLRRAESRRRLGLWLVIGTMPVVVVGLLQALFGWSTPLRALGGALEWTMRYPERATGIFDTVNGTAGWLLISFPFLLQRLREPSHKLLTAAVVVLTSTALLLTSSRSAFVLLPLVILASARKRLVPWLLLAIGLFALLVAGKLAGLTDHWPGINLLVPDLLSAKLERLINPASSTALQTPEIRASLYPIAWQLIQRAPWLGIGENGFRGLYLAGELPLPANEGLNHTHSLPLEFALSHGIPALVLLLLIMGSVCAAALQRWRVQGDQRGQDRAWLLAAGLIILLHICDIPAYDSRFNMADWLIFSALLAFSGGRGQLPWPRQTAPPRDGQG